MTYQISLQSPESSQLCCNAFFAHFPCFVSTNLLHGLLAACFHLFDKVIELDRPFHQTGSDPTQIRFRDLLPVGKGGQL
jgi:hypothetical protein